jgi:hypothetical protein
MLSRRMTAIVAALAVVAVVAAGLVLFRPHSTPTAASLPILGTIPTFPQSGSTPSVAPMTTKSATPWAKPSNSAPAEQAPTPTPTPTATHQASSPMGIFVTYRVVQQWYGGFEGEVSVVNDEPTSISGWRMAIALPYDTFTSWWNATGFMQYGILVLYQPSSTGPIAADGGFLHVFFIARGFETTPADCGFDTEDCVTYSP